MTFPPLAFTADIKPRAQLNHQLRASERRTRPQHGREPALPPSHGTAPCPSRASCLSLPTPRLAGGKLRHPVPAVVPPAPAAATTQSPRAICHTNPSLTAYPSSPFVLPAGHKSAGKQLGMKENKNSCGHKGVWHSLGIGFRVGCVVDSLPGNFWVRFGQ